MTIQYLLGFFLLNCVLSSLYCDSLLYSAFEWLLLENIQTSLLISHLEFLSRDSNGMLVYPCFLFFSKFRSLSEKTNKLMYTDQQCYFDSDFMIIHTMLLLSTTHVALFILLMYKIFLIRKCAT